MSQDDEILWVKIPSAVKLLSADAGVKDIGYSVIIGNAMGTVLIRRLRSCAMAMPLMQS